MTSRERQLSTIRHEIADRISVDAICVENQPQIAHFLGIRPEAVLDRLGLDGRIVSAGYLGDLDTDPDGMPLTEWGTPNTGDYGTARAYPLRPDATIVDVEGHRWPELGLYDFGGAGRTSREWAGQYALRGPYWKPLFCQVCDLFGMEAAMLRLLGEPSVFEAALDVVFQHTVEFCERLLSACGDAMPILCLGDDFATQRGLMISPQHWRVMLKPRFARLFEIGKRAGKFVWFHSCGDITAILPDLIDIGMDVWETVQLHTLPMSPAELKREYGRHLTFFGGVNTQRLPFTTPEEVRAEVIHCIKVLGESGGYICGPDHHLKPDVPPENAVALFDAARGFRQPGYTTTTP